jgi:hypothetical protein
LIPLICNEKELLFSLFSLIKMNKIDKLKRFYAKIT